MSPGYPQHYGRRAIGNRCQLAAQGLALGIGRYGQVRLCPHKLAWADLTFAMSAIPPTTAEKRTSIWVRFMPKADVTLSRRDVRLVPKGNMVRDAFLILRLAARSYLQ